MTMDTLSIIGSIFALFSLTFLIGGIRLSSIPGVMQ